MNWEDKSSTIYHCTVLGRVKKSTLTLPILLQVQNRMDQDQNYSVWFKYLRPHQTNNDNIEIGCKLRLQQMSFLFHFHMLTLKTSLFKQFSWWCAILFSSQFDALAFWKYKNSGKKRWGNDFISGRLFFEEMNWEEKSSTIYHCTVFGWVIKSVLPSFY